MLQVSKQVPVSEIWSLLKRFSHKVFVVWWWLVQVVLPWVEILWTSAEIYE